MSLLTSTVYRELEGALAPPEQTSSYTLTHTGVGWTLVIRHSPTSPSGWSTPLAPHGAGPGASPRVARAVGVRVLHELGVEVSRWAPAPGGQVGDVVAETSTTTARLLRGLRGH